jgi:hypothetical protein
MSLRTGEFRLVHLEPYDGPSGFREIKMDLQRFRIAQAPPYKAVSYACGQPFKSYDWAPPEMRDLLTPTEVEEPPIAIEAQPGNLIVQGYISRMSRNLQLALDHLQRAGVTGWLWVDAICIRQDDAAERASQVQMMGDIYAMAAEVIIWTGPDPLQVDDVLEVLRKVGPALVDEDRSSPLPFGDPALQERIGVASLYSQKLLMFVLWLESCRWFERTWIIQECILARSARIFIGGHSIPWGQCFGLIERLARWGWIVELMRMLDAAFGFSDRGAIWNAIRLTELHQWARSPMPKCEIALGNQHAKASAVQTLAEIDKRSMEDLSYLLKTSASFVSSDPRDKVYALLGIIFRRYSPRSKLLTKGQFLSYEKPFPTIYSQTISLIMETTRSLDPLAVQTYPISRTCPGYPSWVPDYRNHRPGLAVLTMNSHRGTAPYKASYGMDTVFTSRKSLAPIFRIAESSKLHCTGLHIATIQEIHRRSNEASPLELAVKMNPATGIMGRRTFEVLVRTLLQNDDDNDPQGLFGSSMSALSFSPTYAVDEDAYVCQLLVKYFEPGLLGTDRPRALRAARRVSELLRQFQHREDVAVGHFLGALSPLSERLETFEEVYELVNLHQVDEKPKDCGEDVRRDNIFPLLPEELERAWDKMKIKAVDAVREMGKASDGRVLFRASLSTDIQSRAYHRNENLDRSTEDPSFRTNDIMGACLDDVNIGDQIWILNGASTPFVLRPKLRAPQQMISQHAAESMPVSSEASLPSVAISCEFEYAGDAFIVDFMRGEALKLFVGDETLVSDDGKSEEGNAGLGRKQESTTRWKTAMKAFWRTDRKRKYLAAAKKTDADCDEYTPEKSEPTKGWKCCVKSVVIV